MSQRNFSFCDIGDAVRDPALEFEIILTGITENSNNKRDQCWLFSVIIFMKMVQIYEYCHFYVAVRPL
jgi:hypothetical protein